MFHWKIITGVIFTIVLVTECRRTHHQRREAVMNLCDHVYNNTNSVQCFCEKSKESGHVTSAECYLTKKDMVAEDSAWPAFQALNSIEKLTFINTRGITLNYIPTMALKLTYALNNIDVRYGDIKEIHPYAFANLTTLQEIRLSDNQIETLRPHAFAHHKELTTITLDKNKITEINRDVFVDLPRLEKLYLTMNKLSTLHDRALLHLTSLKELELDKNKIFTLNAESFLGLQSLERLSLSGNSLEVIGDNTFLPLKKLRSLDLDENKIQMLDEKAFSGLKSLQSLSLARNKLLDIADGEVFTDLGALISLNLKANGIRYLRPEVMAPILHNFYGTSNSFEFDENNFPCDCNLDWFLSLKNKTMNGRLKLSIENLKCAADAELNERWKKLEETETNAVTHLDEEPGTKTGDEGEYEYYDDTQLDGKLFYTDVRDLLNCTPILTTPLTPTTILPRTVNSTSATHVTVPRTSGAPNSIITTSPEHQTTVTIKSSTIHETLTAIPMTGQFNRDYTEPTTMKSHHKHKDTENITKDKKSNTMAYHSTSGEAIEDKHKHDFTTSRLATVSAKPIQERRDKGQDNLYKQMAADEAAKEVPMVSQNVLTKPSSANKHFSDIALVIAILVLYLG